MESFLGLYKTVQQICDVLPSLVVTGDNQTVTTSTSKYGTVIRAKPQVASGSPSETETEDNGPFSINVQTIDGVKKIHVNGGVFSFNGKLENLYSSNFNLDSYSGRNYYIVIHAWLSNEWDKVIEIVTGFNEEDGHGYAILGMIYDNGNVKSVYSYNNHFPVVIATETCTYE